MLGKSEELDRRIRIMMRKSNSDEKFGKLLRTGNDFFFF